MMTMKINQEVLENAIKIAEQVATEQLQAELKALGIEDPERYVVVYDRSQNVV